MASADLASLVRSKRVLVTVGAGGVGKTTTAAALSVAAAREGRRVLCLTIDPARRLAESLGIEAMGSDPRRIDPQRFAAAGIPLSGSLTAQMLDTKRTFDELIVKHASSRAKADALLSNRLYKYISTSLAGTQEYMAMEKLVAVKDDPSYDLIVLDTPPTTNALDFLDAPQRLIGALDSAAMRWFVEAFESSGKLSLNLLARSAAVVLRGIGKITGGGFLQDMAGFLVELNDLFGGFKQRAARVEAELRGPDVAFVLVTSPSPASLHEVTYFAERLAEAGMPRGAFVVNRFRLPPPPLGARSPGDVERAIAEHGLRLGDPGKAEARLTQAHADAERLAALDAAAIGALDTNGVPLVLVPELASDVYDVGLLGALGESLVTGGVTRDVGDGGKARGAA
jgi:anion-transporting  ArsA/GET3 family ATPase